MNPQKARPAFLGAAAIYLIYIAYDLFQSRNDPGTSMSPILRYVSVALFGLSAVALLIYAYLLWTRMRRQEREHREEPPFDENNFKS